MKNLINILLEDVLVAVAALEWLAEDDMVCLSGSDGVVGS